VYGFARPKGSFLNIYFHAPEALCAGVHEGRKFGHVLHFAFHGKLVLFSGHGISFPAYQPLVGFSNGDYLLKTTYPAEKQACIAKNDPVG
jgi:hypothetical protein